MTTVSAIRRCGGPKVWRWSILGGMGMLMLLGCGKAPKAQDWAAEQQRKRETNRRALLALASENAAVPDWDQAIEPDAEPGLQLLSWYGVYSLDLQRALVRAEAVAFLAELVDVRADAGAVEFVFEHPGEGRSSVVFVLEADKDDVDHVLRHRPGMFDQCAVVARVSSVDRALLSAPTEVEGEIEITCRNTTYVAKGKCVALKLLSE